MGLGVYMVGLSIHERKNSKIRTIDIFRHFHAHFDKPELVDPVLEIAHETFKHIYSVWHSKWVVKEPHHGEGELMPESICRFLVRRLPDML